MTYQDQMTMNIVNHLEKKPGICEVKNEIRLPAERPMILVWEQKHSLLLPGDLKNFYLSSNGFHLTWSVKMEKATVPVGTMHINSVSQLAQIQNAVNEGSHSHPSLWDLDVADEDKNAPSFVDSRIFELDPCDGYGKVCLVYTGAPKDYSSKIWFLDCSLHWHYICDTFMQYYRLMLMHLGLPHWQFAFTDIGLPPYAKQWYNMYTPIRLEMDTEGEVDLTAQSEISGKALVSPLDVNRVFKEKADRSKHAGTHNPTNLSKVAGPKKQKPPISSARSASVSKQAAQSSSQAGTKSSR